MTAILCAGVAVRDISPMRATFLAGYPHVARTSTGVHDPLLATALYVSDGVRRAVLVAADLLFISPATARRLRAEVGKAAGVDETAVFVSCSHTHSGPLTVDMPAWHDDPVVPPPDAEYLEHFVCRVVEAGAAAARDARPAELAWTTVRVKDVGGNRHERNGPRDPEVGLLAVRDARTHRPLAVSMIYAMHPTVLHEDSTLVSADFPAYARRQIERTWGIEGCVLYHTGPSGNQSPRFHVKGQTFAEAERLGRALGTAACAGLTALPDAAFTCNTVVAAHTARVALAARTMPTPAEAQRRLDRRRAEHERLRRAGAPRAAVRTAECDVFGAEEAVTLARAQATGELTRVIREHADADVQVVRLGDACLAGLPGELFAEWGLTLKTQAAMRTFPVSLVNGELQGYIVTPEAAHAGGYEAECALFEPGSGQRLVDAALGLVRELRDMTP